MFDDIDYLKNKAYKSQGIITGTKAQMVVPKNISTQSHMIDCESQFKRTVSDNMESEIFTKIIENSNNEYYDMIGVYDIIKNYEIVNKLYYCLLYDKKSDFVIISPFIKNLIVKIHNPTSFISRNIKIYTSNKIPHKTIILGKKNSIGYNAEYILFENDILYSLEYICNYGYEINYNNFGVLNVVVDEKDPGYVVINRNKIIDNILKN